MLVRYCSTCGSRMVPRIVSSIRPDASLPYGGVRRFLVCPAKHPDGAPKRPRFSA